MSSIPSSENGARPPAIEAVDLTKEYRLGEHRSLKQTIRHLTFGSVDGPLLKVLSELSVSVGQGETLGIVGTNGSGKSTLLQMIAGITLPTGGRLTVRGRVLPLLAIGTGFHPELTGYENVTLFGVSLGIRRNVIRERIDQVAAFAEIEMHMDTPVKRFSSGMLSRLSFATAVLFPADIYLFDEVLAVVDSEFQDRCLREIKKLSASGKTVIFVSHDLAQIDELCENVLWLESGSKRQLGPTEQVLHAYAEAHGAATE